MIVPTTALDFAVGFVAKYLPEVSHIDGQAPGQQGAGWGESPEEVEMAKSREEYLAENHEVLPRLPNAADGQTCEKAFGCTEEQLIASDPELFGDDEPHGSSPDVLD